MSISSIKREAKSLMKGNFIQLFLFVTLPLLVGGMFSSWSTLQAKGFLYVLFSVLYLLIALFVQYNTYNWITTKDQDLLSFSGLISLSKNPHVLTTQLGIELIIILLAMLLFIPFVNIIALVALIVVSLMLVPAHFITIDKPQLSIGQVVQESIELMKGHKLHYILFSLSFIGWFLLIVITFGLASLWVIPYVHLSSILYYIHLKQHNKKD